jgi:nucleoid-associated protein YgaU
VSLTPLELPFETEHAAVLPRRHVIRSGDTLTSLAHHYYGQEERALEIYRANYQHISDPARLPVGAVLSIP